MEESIPLKEYISRLYALIASILLYIPFVRKRCVQCPLASKTYEPRDEKTEGRTAFGENKSRTQTK